jgi:hypothetical protein
LLLSFSKILPPLVSFSFLHLSVARSLYNNYDDILNGGWLIEIGINTLKELSLWA